MTIKTVWPEVQKNLMKQGGQGEASNASVCRFPWTSRFHRLEAGSQREAPSKIQHSPDENFFYTTQSTLHLPSCEVLMMSATRTNGVSIGCNERLGPMSFFIQGAYCHYYFLLFPYVAGLAMTAYNPIITINLSRNRTRSSSLLYGHRSSFQGWSPHRTKDQTCSEHKAGTLNLSIWKTEKHFKSIKHWSNEV